MDTGIEEGTVFPKAEQPENHSNDEWRRKSDRKRAALRWWVGTVALTLFPTLTTLVVAALREDTQVTVDLAFNNGELVLSSF